MMNLSLILLNSLWAGVFAAGLGVILTTPARVLTSCFSCGFIGRFVRDVCMGWGLSQNWSTAISAAAVVLLAAVIVRHHHVSPVVLVCAVLPLGAAVALFNLIIALMAVSSFKEEALNQASVALLANTGKVFTGSLAIAVGLEAGMTILRFYKPKETEKVRSQIQ